MTVTGGPTPIGPSAFTPDFELQNRILSKRRCFLGPWETSFEIGAEFRRLQSPLANGFFEDQGWNFPSYASFIEGQPISPLAPAYNFTRGAPGAANSYRSFRESDLSPYIQDTWKVSRTVTLELGTALRLHLESDRSPQLALRVYRPEQPIHDGLHARLACVRVESVGEKSRSAPRDRVGSICGSQDFHSERVQAYSTIRSKFVTIIPHLSLPDRFRRQCRFAFSADRRAVTLLPSWESRSYLRRSAKPWSTIRA